MKWGVERGRGQDRSQPSWAALGRPSQAQSWSLGQRAVDGHEQRGALSTSRSLHPKMTGVWKLLSKAGHSEYKCLASAPASPCLGGAGGTWMLQHKWEVPPRSRSPPPRVGLNSLVPLAAQSWESQGAEWCLTLMFVSWEPEATNSPYGWKSRLQMLALCPISVRRTNKGESRDSGVRGEQDSEQRKSFSVRFCVCFRTDSTEKHNSYTDFQDGEEAQLESYHPNN